MNLWKLWQGVPQLKPTDLKEHLRLLFWTCLLLLSFHAPDLGRDSEQSPLHFFHATLILWISIISFIYRLKSPILCSFSKRKQFHSFDLACCFHDYPPSGVLLHFLWGIEPKLYIQCYGLKSTTCSDCSDIITLFCLFFPDFSQYPIFFFFFFFLDLYWAWSWHTELTDIQLTDSMTLLWQGGWSVISPDVSSNFNNSVSLWFKLRGQQVKYFYFATVQDTGITPVPVLCTASATPIQEKWMQTGSSTENHY